jgi:hypothetical protein
MPLNCRPPILAKAAVKNICYRATKKHGRHGRSLDPLVDRTLDRNVGT